MNWCARCHHAIVPRPGGWMHFSDDDWAGAASECPCALMCVPCHPPSARDYRRRLRRDAS